MKYVCLGYFDEAEWKRREASERDELIAACRAYDAELRATGHWAGGSALESPRNAVTLRHGDGRVLVTDGPYAETKEQVGGILYLEARDLNEAIQIMSRHPGIHIGSFEIRAVGSTDGG